MEVNVEVQGAAEALFEGDRACLGRFAGKSSLLGQVPGDASVNYADHLTHDARSAGKQEPQRTHRKLFSRRPHLRYSANSRSTQLTKILRSYFLDFRVWPVTCRLKPWKAHTL